MKKYLIYLFLLLLVVWNGHGQIYSDDEIRKSSPNAKMDSGISSFDMVYLDYIKLFGLNSDMTGGIIGDVSPGGEIKLEVWSYDPNKIDGKGVKIYSTFLDGPSTVFAGNSTRVGYGWFGKTESTDIKKISQSAKLFEPDFKAFGVDPACKNYFTSLESFSNFGKSFFNGFFWSMNAITHAPYQLECKRYIQQQPVIVEATIRKASLHRFKIPGIGKFDAKAFFDPQSMVVEIKGGNYQISPIKNGIQVGHPKSYLLIKKHIWELSKTKIAGLYDNTTGPVRGYFKVKVPASGKLWVALEKGQNINATPFGNGELLYENALTIEDNNAISGYFDVYEVSGQQGQYIKFEADKSGPFVLSHDFDVSFKEDLALPAEKRKLYHRADWPDEVLVCGHRGTWKKVGSHNPPDYSGIAENTIPAYEFAIKNPSIDLIEFDGRRTKDGVFVAWHDRDVARVSNFIDKRECIPVEELNKMDKVWRNTNPDTRWHLDYLVFSKWDWDDYKDLHLRDYLGCKVKDVKGNFMNPLKLEDAFAWLADQKTMGKYSIISVDYKQGLEYLDELYELILKYDLDGQVLLSLYAREFGLADYEREYGRDFLKQIPLKPSFFEPTSPDQYGGNMLQRFNEYVDSPDHFVTGITLNINSDKDEGLIEILNSSKFQGLRDKMWYMSHVVEPFMSSISEISRLTTHQDCDRGQHPKLQLCSNLFWRGDLDWLLNNGTNAIFSDNTESLISYLKAKGKK